MMLGTWYLVPGTLVRIDRGVEESLCMQSEYVGTEYLVPGTR